MQIQINIVVKDNHIDDRQVMFIKSELDNIVRRFQDPEFLPKMKTKLGVEQLVGGVGYTQYDLAIQHVIDESITSIKL